MKKILITGAVCALLTGCAGTDLAAINKNISDTAFSVSKTLLGVAVAKIQAMACL